MVGMGDGTTAVGAVLSMIVVSMVLNRCAEGILEDFGQDIFHVDWDISFSFVIKELGREVRGRWEMGNGNARKSGVGLAVNYDGRCCSERCLAKLAHERATHTDHLSG